MIWLMLEAGLALALLIFIVWWTLPRNARSEEVSASSEEPKSIQEGQKEP
jgi:hypothetical protein